MTKFKSKKRIITLIVILILLLLCVYTAFSIYEKASYEKYAGKEIYYKTNHQIFLTYKNETINLSVYNNSNLYAHFQCLERFLYFDDLPYSQNEIKISVPKKIDLIICCKDDNSIFLKFDVERGIDRNYILNDLNFNELLDILYEITGNDIFTNTGDGSVC